MILQHHGPHNNRKQQRGYYQGRPTAAQQTNQNAQHWRFDAAGNRLPNLPNDTSAKNNWAEQVQAQWNNPRFNPLGEGQISPNERVQQWIDNRVHYSEKALYHYDGRGNRTRSAQLADGSVQELRYDSYNQLLAIGSYNPAGELTHVSRYRYDSLGRRVTQTVQTYKGGKTTSLEATYYGWDGDSLTTTKTRQGTSCTLYEPGSFTPLIQLYQADASSQPALTEQEQIFRQIEITIASFQAHLSPLDAQRQKEAVFAEAKRQLTADGKWLELEETNPLQIRYYHCNQIGTPLALSDAQGQIVWAAQYDPWGNVQKEYNADPQNIRQDIRLPGQHHDRSTGLYYNRYRFYDPQLGAYVNQDPIGLRGGQPNLFAYPSDPNQWGDPLGLNGWISVPMFNPNLPGNQAAVNQGIKLSKCGGKCEADKKPWISDETLRRFGLPSNKVEVANYLDRQSTIFEGAAFVFGNIPLLQPMAPVFSVTSMLADTGSKMLNPPPVSVIVVDAAVDIVASKIPGGVLKDIAAYSGKKAYSEYAENKSESDNQNCKE